MLSVSHHGETPNPYWHAQPCGYKDLHSLPKEPLAHPVHPQYAESFPDFPGPEFRPVKAYHRMAKTADSVVSGRQTVPLGDWPSETETA